MPRRTVSVRTTFRKDQLAGGAAAMLFIIGGLLVATIMAGVLFKLDGQLSQKGREASDETVRSLGAGLEAVATMGERDDTGQVVRMDLTLRATRGAQTSLTLLAMQVTDGQERHALLSGQVGAHQFGVVVVRDADGSTQNTTRPTLDSGDLVRLEVDLAAIGLALAPGETLTVRILPDHGLDTIIQARAPYGATTDRFVNLE